MLFTTCYQMFLQYRLSMIGRASTIFMKQHCVTQSEYFMNLHFNPKYSFWLFSVWCVWTVYRSREIGYIDIQCSVCTTFPSFSLPFSISIIESWSTLNAQPNNKHTQYSVNRNQFHFLKFIKLLNNLIFVKTWPKPGSPLFGKLFVSMCVYKL